MIQKKTLKDAIQNPEIISVVGGLIWNIDIKRAFGRNSVGKGYICQLFTFKGSYGYSSIIFRTVLGGYYGSQITRSVTITCTANGAFKIEGNGSDTTNAGLSLFYNKNDDGITFYVGGNKSSLITPFSCEILQYDGNVSIQNKIIESDTTSLTPLI